MFEINFTMISLPFNISYHHQTTYQIMEEDIFNYSPIEMFRGTPCLLNSYAWLTLNCHVLRDTQHVTLHSKHDKLHRESINI